MAVDVTANADAGRASPAEPAWRVGRLTAALRAWPVVTGLAVIGNLLALPGDTRSLLSPAIS